MLKVLDIVFVLLCFCTFTTAAYACGQRVSQQGNFTGGACSIEELNNEMKLQKTHGLLNVEATSPVERDLRPFKQRSGFDISTYVPNCQFVICLPRTPLIKVLK